MPCDLAMIRLKEREEESREDREHLKCIIEDICPKCGDELKTLFSTGVRKQVRKRCQNCYTLYNY